jgi:hypothetical protein
MSLKNPAAPEKGEAGGLKQALETTLKIEQEEDSNHRSPATRRGIFVILFRDVCHGNFVIFSL